MNETLRSIISAVSRVATCEILPETNVVKDLGLDSLDIFILVLKLEEYFNIMIEDQDYDKLLTVSGIDQYIFEKKWNY